MRTSRLERTMWRDSALSLRHGRYGADAPALDLDFVLLEFDKGRASAIVEYKNQHASPQWASHPSYQALINLGDRAGLPVFAVRYADDFSWFRIVPLNQKAVEFVPQRVELNEKEYVKLLYRLRGRTAPQSVIDGLDVEI